MPRSIGDQAGSRDFTGMLCREHPPHEIVTSQKGHPGNLKKEAAMKKLLLASMIAIASAFAIAPASADSIQLGIGIGHPNYDDGYYGDDYSGYRHHRYYNRVYDDDNGGYVVREHWRHRHHCVVEEVRVCGNNDY
jgi:hypothetical protein